MLLGHQILIEKLTIFMLKVFFIVMILEFKMQLFIHVHIEEIEL